MTKEYIVVTGLIFCVKITSITVNSDGQKNHPKSTIIQEIDMRNVPEDKYDFECLDSLNAEQWMIDLLKLNPEYTLWGPHEDYMCQKDSGWRAPVETVGWKSFDLELNELNEVVNFYFEIDRSSEKCKVCGGDGYHPDAKWVSDSFYRHSSPFSHDSDIFCPFPTSLFFEQYKNPALRDFCEEMAIHQCWNDRITQEEVELLVAEDRLRDFTHEYVMGDFVEKIPPYMPTAEEINKIQQTGGINTHDCINRLILVEHRCDKFGIPRQCYQCKGNGHVYTAEKAHVNLVLWVLHPRKGASRGWEITHINQDDLPAVFNFLKQAADRNAQRFAAAVGRLQNVADV